MSKMDKVGTTTLYEPVLVEIRQIKDVNLEAELVNQFDTLKRLQDDVLHDESIPLNQRAQLANTVVSALGQLIKLQIDLQRDEVMKIMEATLIESIKTLPEETKDAFFKDYAFRAEQAGLST